MRSKKVFLSLLLLGISMIGFAQDTIILKSYIENMKTTDVFIEGKKYNFLFDTGGAETIISPEVAKHLSKKTYGSTTGFRMNGDVIKAKKADHITLMIGSTIRYHPTVTVWDIMSVLPKEFPKIDGIISLKSFSDQILTLDLAKNHIIIETASSAKKAIQGKTPVPSRFANGLEGSELNIFLNIQKNHQSYWFLFDSGNSGPFLLSTETASALKLPKDKDEMNSETQFSIGTTTMTTRSFTRDIIYDGVFNFEVISKYIFTIDCKNKKVWIK